MPRRSPDQVHDEDGHAAPVASCGRCETEAELERNAEQARAEIVETALTEWASTGVLPGECEMTGCTNPGTHHGRCCTHWRTR